MLQETDFWIRKRNDGLYNAELSTQDSGLTVAQPTKNSDAPPTEEVGTFGKVAMKLGFINQKQLEEAMKAQAAAAKAGLRKRLGEILLKKGYITPEQLQKVLKGQVVSRKRIGDYELISKLGEGGMGAVFKAKQVLMDRIVALKILSPKMAKNKEFCDRFKREARAVAKLNHPHIIAGIDVGSADGYYYFAMEFVDGESLGQYMHRKGGRIDEAVALDFTKQIAQALQHAHENKLLHRDVKPDNVLLDKACRTAKLADLGLARSAEVAAEDASLTQAGQAVGTPFYISPEQARGMSNLSAATDLYSLGATMFHLLTGQVPFDGATAAVIMTRHLTDPVPSLQKINPKITSGTERIVFKLMEKLPDDRYESCSDLIKDIDRVLEGDMLDGKKPKPKASKPAPAASPSVRERDVREVRERERERERDRDRDDERPSGGSSPSINTTRIIRRKKRKQEFELGGFAILLFILAAVLFFLNPFAGPKRLPPRPSEMNPQPVKNEKPPVVVSDPPPPAAVPAALEANADGVRTLKADFESGRADSFEVDPLVGKGGYPLKVIGDQAGNHVLKLGLIRPTSLQAKESGCMVRLLLPKDLQISHAATVSFMVHFENYADANPEIKVFWDFKAAGEPRSVAIFTQKDPTFATSWGKATFQVNKAPSRIPSRETADSPQYIAIYAGKPDESLDVYIDDLEVTIPVEAPVAEKEKPAPTGDAQPDKEAPVTKPKKKTPAADAPQGEAPVAPPPKKKKDEGAFGGAL